MMVAQAQQAIASIVRDLERLDQRLSQIAQAVQAPQFAEESDEPLNLEAAIFSSIINTQKDELAAAIQALQQASALNVQMLKGQDSLDQSSEASVLFSPKTAQMQHEACS